MKTLLKYIIIALQLVVVSFSGGCKDNKQANEEPFGVLLSSSDTIIFYQVGAKDSLKFSVTSPSERQTVFLSYDDELIRVTLKGFVVNPSSNYEIDLRGENALEVELLKPFSTSLKLDIKISQSTYSPTPFEKPITVKFNEDAVLDHLPTKRFTVSKRESVKWNILRKGVVAPSTELFPVTAKVIQGKGVVHLSGDMVWCDSIPDFGQYVKECGSVFGGMFTPLSIGEHKVEYTVWDKQFNTETKTVVSYFADSTKFGSDVSMYPTPIRFNQQQISQAFNVSPEHFVETSYYVRFEGFEGKAYLWDSGNKVKVQEGEKLPTMIANVIKHPDENRFGGQILFYLRTDEKYLLPVRGTVYVGDSWGTEYKWEMVVQGVELDTVAVDTDIREIGEGGRKAFRLRSSQNNSTEELKYSYKVTKGVGVLLDAAKRPLTPETVYPAGERDENGFVITPMWLECAGVKGGNDVELEMSVYGAGGEVTVKKQVIKVVKTLPVVNVILPEKITSRNFDIKLDMSKQDYVGKLKVAYTVFTTYNEPGAGTFDIPSNVEVEAGELVYKYSATVCGKTLIKFEVSDEFGWSKEFVQEFYVDPIDLQVDLELERYQDSYTVNPMYNSYPPVKVEKKDFTFTVKDDGYSGDFMFSYVEIAGDWLFQHQVTGAKRATLLLDGVEIRQATPIKISAGQHTVTLNCVDPTGTRGTIKCSVEHTTVRKIFGVDY